MSLLLGPHGGSVESTLWQTGHVGTVGEYHFKGVGGFQQVRFKFETQPAQLAAQFAVFLACFAFEVGTAAGHAVVGLFEQPFFFGRQGQCVALFIDGFYSLEKSLVEVDVVAVFGQQGGDAFRGGNHFVVAVGAEQIEEYRCDTSQLAARQLHGFDGVCKRGSLVLCHDGVDFGLMECYGFGNGRLEIFGLYPVERCGLMRRVEGRE